MFNELCVEQVRAGNRNNGTMTNRGYENIAGPFYERTGLRHSVKQLRNRWDQLKSLYTFWTYCNKQSGLGKNAAGGIIASDAFWDLHCKVLLHALIPFPIVHYNSILLHFFSCLFSETT